MLEPFGAGVAQARTLAAAVERAKRVAHRAQPQRRAAALVRNRKAIASHGDTRRADLDDADAAGAEDQRGAVAAAMGADIGDRRVAVERDRGKGEIAREERLGPAGARNARNAEPGGDIRFRAAQAGRAERIVADLEQGGVQPVEADAR